MAIAVATANWPDHLRLSQALSYPIIFLTTAVDKATLHVSVLAVDVYPRVNAYGG
jgi:hypothetical protein